MMVSPKQFMDDKEQCWCGSGEQWGKCHAIRETLKRIPDNKQKRIIAKTFEEFGSCLHPDSDEKCPKPIGSHSIQKEGQLSSIAEDRHVFSALKTLNENRRTHWKDAANFIPDGITKRASIFPGFCGFHDGEFFEPIEREDLDNISDLQVFLFSYRALAYELQRRRALIESFFRARKFDAGHGYTAQSRWQVQLSRDIELSSIVLRKMESWKNVFDRMYQERKFDVKYYQAEFDESLPFLTCGAFMPAVDFHGRQFHIADTPEFIIVNVYSYKDRSRLLLSRFGCENGHSEQLIRSFVDIAASEKANTALHFCCEHIENLFFKPSWIRTRSKEEKKVLREKIIKGTKLDAGFEDNKPASAFQNLYMLLKANVLSESSNFIELT